MSPKQQTWRPAKHFHWSSTHPADGPCTGCDKDVVRVALIVYVPEWEPGPLHVKRRWEPR